MFGDRSFGIGACQQCWKLVIKACSMTFIDYYMLQSSLQIQRLAVLDDDSSPIWLKYRWLWR